jgi:hypothetical protein
MALAGMAASADERGASTAAVGPAPAKKLKSGNAAADAVHESSFIDELVAMEDGPALTAVRVACVCRSLQARALP